MYKVETCLAEIIEYSQKDSCYIYPYEVVEGIRSLKHSVSIYNESHWTFKREAYRNNDIENLKNEIYTIKGLRDDAMKDLSLCEDYKEIINKSRENQELACVGRSYSSTLITWSFALALICFGFIIYALLRRWIEK